TISSFMSKVFGEEYFQKILQYKSVQEYFKNSLEAGETIREAALKTKKKFNLDENFSLKLEITVNLSDF
ncbi:MAG TPA: hypothetical protein PKD85_05120, partial [Saprospiraceae bacterium]|nr:hypothetical protein [Saprospiraceae bacterium]